MRFPNPVIGLILAALCACNTQAGELEDICSLVYQKLNSGPHEDLAKSMQAFAHDGKQYHGCVIRFLGNASTVTNTQRSEHLFGNAMPFCPEGKLPAALPGGFLNENGWCSDQMADGPDGTSYRVLRKNVFCAVEGSWDGGDDSDPTYVPSPHYEVVVRCANREHAK